MLELLLLRHGEAALTSPDHNRQLTAGGIAQTQQVLNQRSDCLEGLTACYVSPLVRARQTAQLVSEQLVKQRTAETPLPTEFEVCDGLQPECSVDALIEWLQPQQGRVLLVAHNPLLTLLLNQLHDSGRRAQRHHFTTSTLACLSMPIAASGCAEINWITHPTA
ncbi:MAG: phosphohistidine phosphatase SixA [Motiliproteus sp.]